MKLENLKSIAIEKIRFSPKMKKTVLLGMLASMVFLLVLCSAGSGAHRPQGTIYTHFAGEVSAYDLKQNKFTPNIARVGPSTVLRSYDISWDGRKVLFTLNMPSVSGTRRIVWRNLSDSLNGSHVVRDEKNIRDFRYKWGNARDLDAFISPNEQYIALQGSSWADMPTVVIRADKDEELGVSNPDDVGYHEWGKPVWTADNTLYVRNGGAVYRMRPDNQFKPEKLFNIPAGSSRFSVNPQGTKLVFRMKKHLYMSNTDGSDIKQITQSTTYDWAKWDGEDYPTFSPDGKYIAFTSRASRGAAWSDHDYPDGSWVAVTGGSYGYLAVIPADGRLYDVGDKNSGILILTQDGKSGIPHNGHLVWR